MTLAPKAYRSSHPYLYLPDGWDTGWQAAKASAPSAPAGVLVIGDSISAGYRCSDWSKSYPNLIRNSLAAALGTYADYYPALGLSPINPNAQLSGTPPWSNVLNGDTLTQLENYGWHRTYYNAGGATSHSCQKFTSPYACTRLDYLWVDNGVNYTVSLDGGANTNLTAQTNATDTNHVITTVQIRRQSFTGLASAIHTLDIGWQAAAAGVLPMGCAIYTGNAGGLAFARFTTGAQRAAAYDSTYLAPAVPTDPAALFSGLNPQGSYPYVSSPTSAPTLANGGAGNLTGTFYYTVTFVGNGGETAIGTVSSPITVASSQINLTGIPTAPSNTNCYARNVYRGTSATGPWVQVASITGNVQTTMTDNQQYPSGSPPNSSPSIAMTGFGFPLGPQLAIIELGGNDIQGNGATVTNLQTSYRKLIQALRRGSPNCSVLLVGICNPDTTSSDGVGTTNSDSWFSWLDAMYDIARSYNCGFLNLHAKWGETPVNQGFLTVDVHASDSGHGDIANSLLSIL